MSETTLLMDMLRLYRERSPLGLVEHAQVFLRMSERHRAELLFYMIQHANMALQQRDDAPSRAFKDVERAVMGGDG
jgi:hypothetical protein